MHPRTPGKPGCVHQLRVVLHNRDGEQPCWPWDLVARNSKDLESRASKMSHIDSWVADGGGTYVQFSGFMAAVNFFMAPPLPSQNLRAAKVPKL